MIKRRIVGVKLPDSGVAYRVGLKVALGVARFIVGVGLALGEADLVGVADGVEVKAGPSDASTTKDLVIDFNIPEASFHVMVTLWFPGGKLAGGVHCQSPSVGILTVAVCGVD